MRADRVPPSRSPWRCLRCQHQTRARPRFPPLRRVCAALGHPTQHGITLCRCIAPSRKSFAGPHLTKGDVPKRSGCWNRIPGVPGSCRKSMAVVATAYCAYRSARRCHAGGLGTRGVEAHGRPAITGQASTASRSGRIGQGSRPIGVMRIRSGLPNARSSNMRRRDRQL